MAFIVSIAGSDSSGGAGNQADVACIEALGHHALSVITAITAQDEHGVQQITHSDETTVQAQLDAVFSSFKVGAVKSGMLPKTVSIQALAKTIQDQSKRRPYVLDPVMCASSGELLVQDESIQTMVQELFPLATVVTPNISEAKHLTGRNINTLEEIIDAGKEILKLGCRAVLITRGHAEIEPGMDILLDSRSNGIPYYIHGRYIADRSPRGTGCTYASAIACGLASQLTLYDAIQNAKRFITLAIANAYRVESDYWLLNHQVAAREL
ncbi:MAG: bifunctional hydroxymethylpyrimidine kinase/phosphomethylpyrimidine kinase [Gammaproteobacteria bacterium]|nr:bifunctional hydroxymethylpyrimidine kinase/phosphomethylpyrimidine kinase [Gammaproteobacteria bacterium]